MAAAIYDDVTRDATFWPGNRRAQASTSPKTKTGQTELSVIRQTKILSWSATAHSLTHARTCTRLSRSGAASLLEQAMNVTTLIRALLGMLLTRGAYPLSTPKSAPPFVIVWCHGSGDTGRGARQYVEAVTTSRTLDALAASGVQFEYPTATPRPYQLAGGRVSRSILNMLRANQDPSRNQPINQSIDRSIDQSINQSCEALRSLTRLLRPEPTTMRSTASGSTE